jgi:hypothetical protein
MPATSPVSKTLSTLSPSDRSGDWSLEKKLTEAGEPAAVSWGAQCKAYVDAFDARCIAPLDEGRVGDDCMSRFVAARRVLSNDPNAAETACEMINTAGG